MQFDWIIVVLVTLGISCTTAETQTSQTTNANGNHHAPSASDRDIKRLWASAFQAINEAELKRLSTEFPADTELAPQRINSKRLRWRTNNRHLDARALRLEKEEQREEGELPLEARFSTMTYVEDVNPDYVDVRDHTPSPLPWWF